MRNPDTKTYTYMIAVWTWVFTPAVIAALVGFSAILYSTHNKIIFRSAIIVIIVVMIYYVVLRPILGKLRLTTIG